jgi:hypothetical protein
MRADVIARFQYQVESVEKIDTPEGMSGNDWHRYVIKRKESSIEGMKPGTLKSVTKHAESVAEDLNERFGGRASSVYAAKKRPASK